jgi:hypothetical protein
LRAIQDPKAVSFSGAPHEKNITLLYKELESEAKNPAIIKQIKYEYPNVHLGNTNGINSSRTQFEDLKLVYNPKNKTWHAPSMCVWAEDRIRLPGKLSIATAYKGHQSFFKQILGINKPDLLMHIIALEQKVTDSLDKPDQGTVFEEMMNISALNPTPDALKRLGDCKCFPVRMPLPSNSIEWHNRLDDFAIIDRRNYGEQFSGKIRMLNLSLEEVHSIRGFLDAMDLEKKYLSNAVTRKTSAEDGSLHRPLTENLRKKAYAICR